MVVNIKFQELRIKKQTAQSRNSKMMSEKEIDDVDCVIFFIKKANASIITYRKNMLV